ncbi:hypothetical protein V6N13_101656 [Hibiscus sabdariffa]
MKSKANTAGAKEVSFGFMWKVPAIAGIKFEKWQTIRALLSRPKEADGIKGKERPDDKPEDQDKEIETAKAESGEVLRTLREVPPTHYLLQIESFKALVACLNKMGLRCYRSKDFQVSNYSWKLLLYPGIEKEGNGKIYLSLRMMNPPRHRDIQAVVIFFLYDQREKKYLSIQGNYMYIAKEMKRMENIGRLAYACLKTKMSFPWDGKPTLNSSFL